MPTLLPSDPSTAFPVWMLITRLGEAQILLPALAVVMVWFVWRLKAWPVAATWLFCIGVAALLTTLTKVAFIGWGWGLPSINFTGFSGHAMFAAAVLPVLGATAMSTASARWRPLGIATAYALAAVITLSRVVVHAHSASEALSGYALGCVASALALRHAEAPHTHAPKALVVGMLLWFGLTPAGAPASRSHDLVTGLSLALSGHEHPFTRTMMLQRYRLDPPRIGL